MANKDPLADFAIARVGRPAGGSIETVVGSALSLGGMPARGTEVSVIAYPAGVGGLPVGCQATTGLNQEASPSCHARAWSTAPAARRGSAARRSSG